jgi:hypothetical protein
MGSHYLCLYSFDPGRLREQVGSGDEALTRRLLTAAAKELDPAEFHQVSADEVVRAIIDGAFRDDPTALESQYGGHLNHVFRFVCGELCAETTTTEMWDSREDTPLLYQFIWDDWNGGDEVGGLPISNESEPYAVWRGPASVARYHAEFKALLDAGYDHEYFSAEELYTLVEFLGNAAGAGAGAVVYCEY